MARSKTTAAPPSGDMIGDFEQRLIDTFEKVKPHLMHIGIGAGAVVLVLLIMTFMADQKKQTNAEAHAGLFSALSHRADDRDEAAKDEILAERLDKLAVVEKDFAGTPAAVDAKYHRAALQFSAGKYDDARASFVAFYQGHKDEQPFAAMAHMGEGDCLMGAQQFAEAKAKFKAIASNPDIWADNAHTRRLARFKAGLCDFILGDFAASKETLEALLSEADMQAPEENADELTAPNGQAELREMIVSLLAKMKILTPEEILPVVTAMVGSEEPAAEEAEPAKAGDAATDAPQPGAESTPKPEGSNAGK